MSKMTCGGVVLCQEPFEVKSEEEVIRGVQWTEVGSNELHLLRYIYLSKLFG